MPLPVSGAFHTPFMAPARDRLRKAIAEANPRDTEVPVVSNVDALAPRQRRRVGQPAVGSAVQPGALEALPARRWTTAGVSDFVELGPGGVLTGMAKRTVNDARTISVSTPEDLDKLLEWVAGGSCDRARPLEGEHLFAIERLVVSPAAGVFTPVGRDRRRRDDRRRRRARQRGRRRGALPFAGVLQSYIAVARRAGHRCASPSPGCARPDRSRGDDMPQIPVGVARRCHHRLGRGPARQGASPTTTSPQMHRHHRRLDRRAHRHP